MTSPAEEGSAIRNGVAIIGVALYRRKRDRKRIFQTEKFIIATCLNISFFVLFCLHFQFSSPPSICLCLVGWRRRGEEDLKSKSADKTKTHCFTIDSRIN